jgi:hypothetical protein
LCNEDGARPGDQGMLKHSRSFLAGAFFVFVLVALALIGTLSPSYQKCAADHERNHGQNEQHDLHEAIADRVHIPAFLLCEGAFIDENNGTLTALATIAIAAFTLTLWRATTEQGRLTRDTLRFARDEFIATHRPRIVIRHVQFAGGNSYRVGKKLCISFRFWNAGDTEAKIVEICTDVIVAGIIEYLSPRFHRYKPTGLFIKAGDGDLYEAVSHDVFSNVDQASLVGVRSHIFLVGYITYEDGVGGTRQKGFCRRYLPWTNRFIVEKESDYEYDD